MKGPLSWFSMDGCSRGNHADVIVQLDSCVGEILKTLDRLDLADGTMPIFTSDNGPIVDDGCKDQAVELLDGHRPAGEAALGRSADRCRGSHQGRGSRFFSASVGGCLRKTDHMPGMPTL